MEPKRGTRDGKDLNIIEIFEKVIMDKFGLNVGIYNGILSSWKQGAMRGVHKSGHLKWWIGG